MIKTHPEFSDSSQNPRERVVIFISFFHGVKNLTHLRKHFKKGFKKYYIILHFVQFVELM